MKTFSIKFIALLLNVALISAAINSDGYELLNFVAILYIALLTVVVCLTEITFDSDSKD